MNIGEQRRVHQRNENQAKRGHSLQCILVATLDSVSSKRVTGTGNSRWEFRGQRSSKIRKISVSTTEKEESPSPGHPPPPPQKICIGLCPDKEKLENAKNCLANPYLLRV